MDTQSDSISLNVRRIIELLDRATIIREKLNPKLKSDDRFNFSAMCQNTFAELVSLKTKSPYTCLKKLLLLYVKTRGEAELTFKKFKLLIPFLFNVNCTFKTRAIHFCDMRKSIKLINPDLGEFASIIFRLTREDGLEHKRTYIPKQPIVLNTPLSEYMDIIVEESRIASRASRATTLIFATGCKLAEIIYTAVFTRTEDDYVIVKAIDGHSETIGLIGLNSSAFFAVLFMVKQDIADYMNMNKSILQVTRIYTKYVVHRIRVNFPVLETNGTGVKKIQSLHKRILVDHQSLMKTYSIFKNIDMEKELETLKETIRKLKRKAECEDDEAVASPKRQKIDSVYAS